MLFERIKQFSPTLIANPSLLDACLALHSDEETRNSWHRRLLSALRGNRDESPGVSQVHDHDEVYKNIADGLRGSAGSTRCIINPHFDCAPTGGQSLYGIADPSNFQRVFRGNSREGGRVPDLIVGADDLRELQEFIARHCARYHDLIVALQVYWQLFEFLNPQRPFRKRYLFERSAERGAASSQTSRQQQRFVLGKRPHVQPAPPASCITSLMATLEGVADCRETAFFLAAVLTVMQQEKFWRLVTEGKYDEACALAEYRVEIASLNVYTDAVCSVRSFPSGQGPSSWVVPTNTVRPAASPLPTNQKYLARQRLDRWWVFLENHHVVTVSRHGQLVTWCPMYNAMAQHLSDAHHFCRYIVDGNAVANGEELYFGANRCYPATELMGMRQPAFWRCDVAQGDENTGRLRYGLPSPLRWNQGSIDALVAEQRRTFEDHQRLNRHGASHPSWRWLRTADYQQLPTLTHALESVFFG